MAAPLAERLRPQTLDDYIGQKHVGKVISQLNTKLPFYVR